MHFKNHRLFCLMLTGMLLLYGVASHAGSFVFDVKVVGADQTSVSFGHLGDADDAADALDQPFPPGLPTRDDVEDPNIPTEGVLNYFYFQGGQGSYDPSKVKAVYDAFYLLAEDYKENATSATTWALVVADTVGATVALGWEKTAGEVPSGATLKLVDENGAVKVADMRTTTSASLAKGRYFIKYVEANADEAPATPAPLKSVIAKAAGATKSFILGFDPDEFEITGSNVYYYLNGALLGQLRNGAVSVDGNVLSFTMPDNIDEFDEVVITYTYTRGDGKGSATGSVELKPDEIIEIELAEVAVDGVAADISGTPVKVKVDYADANTKAEYQLVTVTYKLTGVAEDLAQVNNKYEFVGPIWKGTIANYPWDIEISVDGVVVPFVEEFAEADGKVQPTFSANLASATGQVIIVDLLANGSAKGGTIDFSIIALDNEGEETTNLYKATPVTLQLKGDANLDVNGDGEFNLVDVRLIYNFAGAGSFNLSALIAGTRHILDDADGFQQKLFDMTESLDIDGDGEFNLVDVRLIYNFAGAGSFNDQALLAGTRHGMDKVAEIKAKLNDMLDQ